MAQATTIRFGRQALLIESSPGSGVFTAPCGITSLNKSVSTETTTTNVPDCDDPDLASWLEIDEVSKQMTVGGSGVLATEALPMWQAWSYDGGYKNVRWYRDLTTPQGGGYYEGPALLTTFDESAEAKARYQVSFGVTFTGKPTWVPA